MAVTYTENLHLGLQLDKTDYLNWDVIQQNWMIIDGACGGSLPQNAIVLTESVPVQNTPEILTNIVPVT